MASTVASDADKETVAANKSSRNLSLGKNSIYLFESRQKARIAGEWKRLLASRLFCHCVAADSEAQLHHVCLPVLKVSLIIERNHVDTNSI